MKEEKKMMKKLELDNPTVYQTNENCQVFNGPISGCVFAMPGASVNLSSTQQVESSEQDKSMTLTYSEQKTKAAIEEIMNMQDDQDEYIFKDQEQWYAVYKVLSTFCGYPAKMTDFERVIKDMGCGDLRIPCKYESFRKVPDKISQLPPNIKLWPSFNNSVGQTSKKILVVALKLMDLLGIKA